MNIGKDTVVTITYIVRDMEGKLLEESDQPVSYLHGGYDNIFPLVEQALEGKAVGDKIDLKLQPADAFGEYEEDLVRLEPREGFPADRPWHGGTRGHDKKKRVHHRGDQEPDRVDAKRADALSRLAEEDRRERPHHRGTEGGGLSEKRHRATVSRPSAYSSNGFW